MRAKRSTEELPGSGRPTKRQRAMLAHKYAGEPLSEANTPHTIKSNRLTGSVSVKKSSGSIHNQTISKERTQRCAVKERSNTESRPSKRQRTFRAPVPLPLPDRDLRFHNRYSGPNLGDTDEGHYECAIGDNLTPRFKIMRNMGEGTFGRVVECWDRRRNDYVAIKIIRSVAKYRDAAMIELQALSTLAASDPTEKYPIVRLLEWFDYRNHVCMVFTRLGPSIYDCLRVNHYKPFPIHLVRSYMRQLLEAVAYMHSCCIVHTDLKPENILFVDKEFDTVPPPPGSLLARKLPPRSDLRLIDFGSATFDEGYHSSIVSTRHYRAPEIILGLRWSRQCDLWSLGCILVELLTGDALFQTHDNSEHLAMMEKVMGATPIDMARRANSHQDDEVCRLYHHRTYKLKYPGKTVDQQSLRAVNKLRPLKQYLKAHGDSSITPYVDDITDLVHRLMEWEPSKRCSAEDALKHVFFTQQR